MNQFHYPLIQTYHIEHLLLLQFLSIYVLGGEDFVNNNIGTGYLLEIEYGSNVKVIHSTFDDRLSIHSASVSAKIMYSNVPGGIDSLYSEGVLVGDSANVTWGPGNIDVDPLFVDSDNGDFSLTADSRCIDTGHPDSTDADGWLFCRVFFCKSL